MKRKLWLLLMYVSRLSRFKFIEVQFSLFKKFVVLLLWMEYRAEKKGKKKAYSRLKQIARLHGKKPPPNPYPSAIKEIQAEERKFVRDRFYNRDILKIVEKLKEERQAELHDRRAGGGW